MLVKRVNKTCLFKHNVAEPLPSNSDSSLERLFDKTNPAFVHKLWMRWAQAAINQRTLCVQM